MSIVFTSSERIVVPILLLEYRQSLLILFPALPALPYFNLFLPYNLFGFSGKSKLFPLSFIRPVFYSAATAGTFLIEYTGRILPHGSAVIPK
jgi:hypothetical protein